MYVCPCWTQLQLHNCWFFFFIHFAVTDAVIALTERHPTLNQRMVTAPAGRMLGPTNKCTEATYRSVHFWHQKTDLLNLCSPVEALQRPQAIHGIPLHPTHAPQWHIVEEEESTK